jgi:hypothetical protein
VQRRSEGTKPLPELQQLVDAHATAKGGLHAPRGCVPGFCQEEDVVRLPIQVGCISRRAPGAPHKSANLVIAMREKRARGLSGRLSCGRTTEQPGTRGLVTGSVRYRQRAGRRHHCCSPACRIRLPGDRRLVAVPARSTCFSTASVALRVDDLGGCGERVDVCCVRDAGAVLVGVGEWWGQVPLVADSLGSDHPEADVVLESFGESP